jgi:hypothetical protein
MSQAVEGDTRTAVDALLHDFDGRWDELLKFEEEVSRWFTLYVTGVIVVVGWLMSDNGCRHSHAASSAPHGKGRKRRRLGATRTTRRSREWHQSRRTRRVAQALMVQRTGGGVRSLARLAQ